MNVITSLDNEKVKLCKKLQKKKYRDEYKLFVVEGAHLALEAFRAGILEELILEEHQDLPFPSPFCYFSKEVMSKVSTMDTPSTVLGLCRKIDNDDVIGERILVLDNVQDPGNLGTIIRSSVAFDIDTIVLSPNTVDIYNPKVIRSTQGMIFYTNIITLELKEFINEIKTKNYTIFGTNVRNGKNIKEITLPEKFALVLGNEGQGVSKEIESLCDDNIYIKMSSKCESLNVSVATSILLYEVYNK